MKGTQSKKKISSCGKCILIATVLIFIIVGATLGYFCGKQKTIPATPTSSTCPSISSTPPLTKEEICNENNKITYKTFSSPKADFTFEYPSSWVYDEREVNSISDGKEIKTMAWGFYPNLEGDYRNRPPYLEVHSPTYETVDFCSGGPATAKGDPYGFTISVFPTNDPETFITYEQSCGYIYWQKGKYFANSADIDDIYYKVNLMVFYGLDELDESKVEEIGKHIAQSIKIK